MMDGSVAISQQATKFYLTRVFEGPTSFRGQAAATRVSLVNPNSVPITLKLTLRGATSVALGTKTLALAARGYYFDSVANTFAGIPSVSSGYIEVECVEGPGAIGFELVQLTNHTTLIGLNAAVPDDATRLYSAQLAEVPGLFTNIKLINTSDSALNVDLTAVLIDADGKPFTQVSSKSLKAGEVLERDAASIFGWAAGAANVGSLRVDSSGPGLIGDVVFGDTGYVYNAALLLQTERFKKAVFSQVANGLGLFTGLALYNPGGTMAAATIQVFSEDGEITGEATVHLGPYSRTAQLLTELVPSTIDQIKGYVIIQSELPLIAQQLFGDGRFLAAVPPTVLE